MLLTQYILGTSIKNSMLITHNRHGTPLVCKFAQFGRQLLPNLHIKNFSLNFKLLYIGKVFCTNYASIFNCISSSTIKYPYPLIRFIQSQRSNLQNCTHIRTSKSIFAYVPIQDLVLLPIKLSTTCNREKRIRCLYTWDVHATKPMIGPNIN